MICCTNPKAASLSMRVLLLFQRDRPFAIANASRDMRPAVRQRSDVERCRGFAYSFWRHVPWMDSVEIIWNQPNVQASTYAYKSYKCTTNSAHGNLNITKKHLLRCFKWQVSNGQHSFTDSKDVTFAQRSSFSPGEKTNDSSRSLTYTTNQIPSSHLIFRELTPFFPKQKKPRGLNCSLSFEWRKRVKLRAGATLQSSPQAIPKNTGTIFALVRSRSWLFSYKTKMIRELCPLGALPERNLSENSREVTK